MTRRPVTGQLVVEEDLACTMGRAKAVSEACRRCAHVRLCSFCTIAMLRHREVHIPLGSGPHASRQHLTGTKLAAF